MLKKVRDADIHLLRVFVAVAESGGFAAAQDRLNVAASTISTQISNLEIRLGFRLCERGRSGFALTDQGEVVLQSTYKLLRDLGDFINRIEATQDDLVGTVRIALLDDILTNPRAHLTRALHRLRADHPYLQFEIHHFAPGATEGALLKKDADIAVSWFGTKTPSLSYEHLFDEEHAVYCGLGHPFFDAAPHGVDLSAVEEADWVTRGYTLPQTIRFSAPPTTSAASWTMEGIAYFILAGTHIGYLPTHYAQRWEDSGQVRQIRPEEFNYSLDMTVALRSDMETDKRVSAVRDAILAAHPERSG
ncbi:LysR family transcriptional regulator [Mangrovicoccus sp. HB161399]|uniref:LysR family transcriptional regulator n=1 Tax=Mangrovicoccus sp. HB161399 TaxID=2720392 RepID=UPI001554570F|nr:LysR family transcriptional regulator [Mangrovicoccus sp. HB161399]